MKIDVRQQRRDDRPLRGALRRRLSYTVFHHARRQPFTDEAQHAPVANPVFHKPHHPLVADAVEEPLDVGVQYPVHRLALDADRERVQRIMLSPSGPKPVGEAEEVRLVDRIENLDHGALDNLILQRRDPQRPLPAIRFRDVGTKARLCPIGAKMDTAFKVAQMRFQSLSVGVPCHPVHTGRRVPFQPVVRLAQQRCVDVVQ